MPRVPRRRLADPADWDDTDFIDEEPDWEYRPPLPADGIRAESRRGVIGEQWWSRRFVEVLEAGGAGARLSRGRSYARKGQVLSLDISPGFVTARVQGSRTEPYEVRLGVDILGEDDWAGVEAALAESAAFAAALLAGRITPEIEAAFTSCGVALFPGATGLSIDCTCPDWQVPCKHAAAVCYLAAESFDTDPFRYLLLRGRSRDALLAGLRGRRSGAASDRLGAGEQTDVRCEAEAPVAVADHLGDFWACGDLDPVRPVPRSGPVADVALARLGPSGLAVGPLPVEDLLRPMYLRITRAAESRALGDQTR